MAAPYSDPVLDALVAASESLMLSSPSPRSASGGARGAGGLDALSELEGTTSSKSLYCVSDDIDCSDDTLCFGMIGAGSSICVRKNCTVSKHSVTTFHCLGPLADLSSFAKTSQVPCLPNPACRLTKSRWVFVSIGPRSSFHSLNGR